MVDAFVVERLHLRVRGPVAHIDNTSAFEKSVLSAVCNEQVRRMSARAAQRGLLGETIAHGGDAYAKQMRVASFSVSVGDIVLRGSQGGEVCAVYSLSLSLPFCLSLSLSLSHSAFCRKKSIKS